MVFYICQIYFSKLTGKYWLWVVWGCRYSCTTSDNSKAGYSYRTATKNSWIYPIIFPMIFSTSNLHRRNWCRVLQTPSTNLLNFCILANTWFNTTKILPLKILNKFYIKWFATQMSFFLWYFLLLKIAHSHFILWQFQIYCISINLWNM